MKIREIGKYVLITGIPSLEPKGEIRQLYRKDNSRMLQLLITDKFVKRTVIDTHLMKTLQESIKEIGSNLIRIIKN